MPAVAITIRTSALSALLLGATALSAQAAGYGASDPIEPIYDAPVTQMQYQRASIAVAPASVQQAPAQQHYAQQLQHVDVGHAPAPQPVVHAPTTSAFVPVAPALPRVPNQGETPCEYYGEGQTCGTPTPTVTPEAPYVRPQPYLVKTVQKPVYVNRVIEKPVVKVVEKPVYVERPPIKVVKKKTRAFNDFWSYIGLGATYRQVTIPSAKGSASKFNFYAADVRAGVMWKKFLGVEARLGLSGGGSAQDYDCGAGYSCSLTLSAPQTAGIYARASAPLGKIAPYAVVGAAYKNYKATLTDYLGSSEEEFSLWGLSYGAGVEFSVNHALMVGAEYLRYGHDDHGFGINARYVF